jgi:excisionase family DNA binding protein
VTLDETIRAAVREEVRTALREELPEALRTTLKTRAPPTMESSYLSTAEAAKTARVRPETIRAWISAGKLAEHWAGRERRVRRDELEAFMAGEPGRGPAEVDLKQTARGLLAKHRDKAG